MSERDLLSRTAAVAADYLETLDTRPVGTSRTVAEMRGMLASAVPAGPTDAQAVVEEMARVLDPGVDLSDGARDPMGYSPEFSRRARSAPYGRRSASSAGRASPTSSSDRAHMRGGSRSGSPSSPDARC